MPGSLVTMERRVPVSRLKSVDLPTLGRPTITSDGSVLVMEQEPRDTCRNPASNVTFHCNSLAENWERSRAQGIYDFTCVTGLVADLGFFVERFLSYSASSARASISSGRSPI